jgi:hypothetical protein
MARKEDKLRPYRVDYFDISEMQQPDKALVQSVIVRAVTALEAIDEVANSAPLNALDLRIIVRAHRFYKKLGARKQNVYKAVEDLFPVNRAVKIMKTVEAYRRAQIDAQFKSAAGQMPADPLASDANARRNAELEAAQCPYGYPSGANNGAMTAHDCPIHKVEDVGSRAPVLPATADANGHITRFSDSSLYDEVCNLCGATDASGKLDEPCPSKVIDPGPNTWSGGLKIPAPSAQQIDVYQTKVDDTPAALTFPDHPVVPTKPAVFDNGHWSGCTCASCAPSDTVRGLGFQDPALPADWQQNLNPSSDPANYVLTSTGTTGASWKKPGMSLLAKLGIFAIVAVSLVLIVNAVLSK